MTESLKIGVSLFQKEVEAKKVTRPDLAGEVSYHSDTRKISLGIRKFGLLAVATHLIHHGNQHPTIQAIFHLLGADLTKEVIPERLRVINKHLQSSNSSEMRSITLSSIQMLDRLIHFFENNGVESTILSHK